MLDLLFLLITFAFFASCVGLIRFAGRLMPEPPGGNRPEVSPTAAIKNGHDRPDAR